MCEQTAEGPIPAEAREQAFVTQGTGQATIAPLLSQALEVSIDVFRDRAEFVGDYQEAVALSRERREEIYSNEAQNGIGRIKKLGDENEASTALPRAAQTPRSFMRCQLAPALSSNLASRGAYLA